MTAQVAAESLVSIEPEKYLISPAGVELLGSQSDVTGNTFWPRRLRCPETGGTVHPVSLASTGTIWSWTLVSFPWSGEFSAGPETGYYAALVDLDKNGPRVVAVLLQTESRAQVGSRVQAVPLPFRTVDDHVLSILAFEEVTA